MHVVDSKRRRAGATGRRLLVLVYAGLLFCFS
jgi:hypothetical protein